MKDDNEAQSEYLENWKDFYDQEVAKAQKTKNWDTVEKMVNELWANKFFTNEAVALMDNQPFVAEAIGFVDNT
jgi:hypothetical protein